MARDRNVHSLSLVLAPHNPFTSASQAKNQLWEQPSPSLSSSSSSSPLHSPFTLQTLDTAAHDLQNSIALKSQGIGRLHHESVNSLSLSNSAVFSQGVLTPITPTFSPSQFRSNNPYKHIKSSLSVSIAQVSEDDMRDMDNMHSMDVAVDSHEAFFTAASPEAYAAPKSAPGLVSPLKPHDSHSSSDDSSGHEDESANLVVKSPVSERASYGMLSNMPTPPLTHSEDGVSPVSSSEYEDSTARIESIPAANYLATLIPLSASAHQVCMNRLQNFLEHFPATLTTIACAGIILDAITPKAIRSWRNTMAQRGLWNDCADSNKGELLVLVAVALSHAWFNDEDVCCRNSELAHATGYRFTCREIHITKMELLEACDYNLMGLFSQEEVDWCLKQLEEWRERCFGRMASKDSDDGGDLLDLLESPEVYEAYDGYAIDDEDDERSAFV